MGVDVDVDVDVAVCERPKASKQIGQTSTSCLQKFTIHFRRPDKLKQNKDTPYKGQYGFDWLRDEYIYPMETVFYDEYTSKPDPNSPGNWYIPISPLNKTIELCINPKKLKEDYLKAVPHQIKPHSQDYYPAWLSIFACNVQGDNADAGSKLHEDGVYLDLQLDEIDKIIDDETEIFFEPSDPCLKITPEKISISEFLKTSRKDRELNGDTHKPVIYYYLLENAVKIICQGDTLKQHGKIKVFAKRGPTKIEVGRLMVYKNNQIGKANIVVVNVITEDYNNKKVIPQSHLSFKDLYNYQSFNQAMIKVEIKAIEDFDLVDLKNKDNDIISFLRDAKNINYSDSIVSDPENPEQSLTGGNLILRRLSALYKKYGKHAPKGKIGLNGEEHHNTYLFLTAIESQRALGLTYSDEKENDVLEWGNVSMIFKDSLTNDRTVIHETGHSFSLYHTFDKSSLHVFQLGYTDNVMDSTQYLDPTIIDNDARSNNRYIKKMHSFYKWQWDIIRKDKSIEYNEKK